MQYLKAFEGEGAEGTLAVRSLCSPQTPQSLNPCILFPALPDEAEDRDHVTSVGCAGVTRLIPTLTCIGEVNAKVDWLGCYLSICASAPGRVTSDLCSR